MSGHNAINIVTEQQTASVNQGSSYIDDIKTQLMRNQLSESDILLLYNQNRDNAAIQNLLRPHMDKHIMHV